MIEAPRRESPSAGSRFSGPRFWLVYAAAWLPYLAANVALSYADAEDGTWIEAFVGGIYFVVPAALLGVGVVIFHRRPRPRLALWRIALVEIALGSLYTALFIASVLGREAWILASRGEEVNVSAVWCLWLSLTGFMLYFLLAAVTYGLSTAARLQREEKRAARAEVLRSEAELAALRAQLNPHFLFNTLHSLLALVRHDPARAEEALEQFGDLLRYTLRVQQETVDEVTLTEEWTFVETYLELEKLRLGERLRLEIDLEPAALACRVPVFVLQPLVENAVRHAVAPRARGGTIRVAARLEADVLCLTVADDGAGADPSRSTSTSDAGLGLDLVRQRLAVLTRGRARCEIETGAGGGFTVRLSIPVTAPSPPRPPRPQEEDGE